MFVSCDMRCAMFRFAAGASLPSLVLFLAAGFKYSSISAPLAQTFLFWRLESTGSNYQPPPQDERKRVSSVA